jgi:hypothetical protein
MHYDFVPMPERKALRWPDGKRLALMIALAAYRLSGRRCATRSKCVGRDHSQSSHDG